MRRSLCDIHTQIHRDSTLCHYHGLHSKVCSNIIHNILLSSVLKSYVVSQQV